MRLVRHPVLCNYYVTYRCNAKCHFCDIWERPSPFIKWEDVQQNLRDLKALGVRVVDFTGGEPLLHPELPRFLGEAKALGLITTVTTNAVRYPRMAEALRGKVDMLHFSLDSPERETHDRIRGVPCYDAVMESLEIAQSLGERPDILFTVTAENFHEIEKTYLEITQLRKLVLLLNPVFGYNEIDDGGSLNAEQLTALSAWGKRPGVYLNEAFIRLRQDGGNKVKSPVCRAGSSTVVISPENKLILPCYHLGLEEFSIEGNLKALWRSQPVQAEIKKEGRHAGCVGCVVNCYMQPSFAVNLNKYFFLALPSTLKYNFMKGTWRALLG